MKSTEYIEWDKLEPVSYTHLDVYKRQDQGEAVLNPIQFDAETTGWVDADNKDVNVKP